jgi:hypothetical protein
LVLLRLPTRRLSIVFVRFSCAASVALEFLKMLPEKNRNTRLARGELGNSRYSNYEIRANHATPILGVDVREFRFCRWLFFYK